MSKGLYACLAGMLVRRRPSSGPPQYRPQRSLTCINRLDEDRFANLCVLIESRTAMQLRRCCTRICARILAYGKARKQRGSQDTTDASSYYSTIEYIDVYLHVLRGRKEDC
jgi:hypothetical protein